MVFSKDQEVNDGRRKELNGAGEITSRSSPVGRTRFHNFSLPTMNWGSQRFLRCVKHISWDDGSAARSMTPDTEIEPQGERNASYYPSSVLPMLSHAGGSKEKDAEQKNASSAAAEKATAPPACPWNLRKRRATCYASMENGRKQYRCSSPPNPPLGNDNPGKPVMRRSVVSENGRRRKFSIPLSRKEIEADFLVFKGTKPNRRPKKRPRVVQKALDDLFPGVCLSEIKADMYKVDQ